MQRQASEKEKCKELPTLKDNDFLEEKYKLMLPADAKGQLMMLLKSDTGKQKKIQDFWNQNSGKLRIPDPTPPDGLLAAGRHPWHWAGEGAHCCWRSGNIFRILTLKKDMHIHILEKNLRIRKSFLRKLVNLFDFSLPFSIISSLLTPTPWIFFLIFRRRGRAIAPDAPFHL